MWIRKKIQKMLWQNSIESSKRDIRNGNTFNIESHIFGNVAKTGAYHSTKFRRNDENIGE